MILYAMWADDPSSLEAQPSAESYAEAAEMFAEATEWHNPGDGQSIITPLIVVGFGKELRNQAMLRLVMHPPEPRCERSKSGFCEWYEVDSGDSKIELCRCSNCGRERRITNGKSERVEYTDRQSSDL